MWIIAGLVAALLTLFDLDKTFYIPSSIDRQRQFWFWYLGFILINGVVASLLYLGVKNDFGLDAFEPWMQSFIVGLAYLAILRSKFTTFSFGDKHIPLGVELFYNASRDFVYKRINSIIKQARVEETRQKAMTCSLKELSEEALLSISLDALMTPSEKEEMKNWVNKILQEAKDSEDDRAQRYYLANYILSGRINR